MLELAPDALEKQVGEEQIFAFDDPVPELSVALPTGAVSGSGGEPRVADDAEVAADAVVGPGSVRNSIPDSLDGDSRSG